MKNSNTNTELNMLLSTHRDKCFTRTKRVYDKGILQANDEEYYTKDFLEALKFRTVFMIEVDEFKKYVINDFDRYHKLGKPVEAALRIIEKYRMNEDSSSAGEITFGDTDTTGMVQVGDSWYGPIARVEELSDQDKIEVNLVRMTRKQMVEMFAEYDARRKVIDYIESSEVELKKENLQGTLSDKEFESIDTRIKGRMPKAEIEEYLTRVLSESQKDGSPILKPEEIKILIHSHIHGFYPIFPVTKFDTPNAGQTTLRKIFYRLCDNNRTKREIPQYVSLLMGSFSEFNNTSYESEYSNFNKGSIDNPY